MSKMTSHKLPFEQPLIYRNRRVQDDMTNLFVGLTKMARNKKIDW